MKMSSPAQGPRWQVTYVALLVVGICLAHNFSSARAASLGIASKVLTFLDIASTLLDVADKLKDNGKDQSTPSPQKPGAYAAGDYSLCTWRSSLGEQPICDLNPLYLASAQFGEPPVTPLQRRIMQYADQSKQCAAYNTDGRRCAALPYCQHRIIGITPPRASSGSLSGSTSSTSSVTTQAPSTVCMWVGTKTAEDVSDLLPQCTGAIFDDLANYEECPGLSTFSSCSAARGCVWRQGQNGGQSECAANLDQRAALAARDYIVFGRGEWNDAWYGTCPYGQVVKTIYAACHGPNPATCDPSKCTRQQIDDPSQGIIEFCTPDNESDFVSRTVVQVLLGDNQFTRKMVHAAAVCNSYTSATACQSTKGPPLSNQPEGSAVHVTRSLALVAASALAASILLSSMLA